MFFYSKTTNLYIQYIFTYTSILVYFANTVVVGWWKWFFTDFSCLSTLTLRQTSLPKSQARAGTVIQCQNICQACKRLWPYQYRKKLLAQSLDQSVNSLTLIFFAFPRDYDSETPVPVMISHPYFPVFLEITPCYFDLDGGLCYLLLDLLCFIFWIPIVRDLPRSNLCPAALLEGPPGTVSRSHLLVMGT